MSELPPITGQSASQIDYATDMRARALSHLDHLYSPEGIGLIICDERGNPINGNDTKREYDIIRAALLRRTDARTWIDEGGRVRQHDARAWRYGVAHPFLTVDEIAEIIALRTAATVDQSTAEAAPEQPKTSRQIADMLGVSLSTVYRRIRAGILAAVKVAGRWQIAAPAAA